MDALLVEAWRRNRAPDADLLHDPAFSAPIHTSVPVIAADRTSLPEVVGDGGLLVAPTVDVVAEAIVTLVADPGRQSDLRNRGLARAATFTWHRTAELTVAAYRDALRAG